MKKILTILIFLLLSHILFGQKDSLSKKGFYIPKNIDECNQQLDKTLEKKAKEKLKVLDENSLGRIGGIFIINEWFDNDSTRLANYFGQFSIIDPDERELLIISAFYWKLNNKPFDIVRESKNLTDRKDSLKLLREIQYKINISADSIVGVFIPSNLEECFTQLDKLLNDTIKQEIKGKNTEDLYEYHMGLGRWMRNNWGLWGGSRLQKYFLDRNVNHPDNMSGIIIIAYHKYLNGLLIDADQIIKEELLREEEFVKNSVTNLPPIKFVPPDKKKYYSTEYRKFLRTKKIKDFELYY
jgi:hypothetical protein